MYLAEKSWWENGIGGSDDSMTLAYYLAHKGKEELPLGEIFSDFGLDKLCGDFRKPGIPLAFTDAEGWEMDIHYAIDMLSYLAALLLECRASGSIDLSGLAGSELEGPGRMLRITATPEEHGLLDRALQDFAAGPLEYDLSEMAPEEELREMAAACGELRRELYG